jgi:hypothetical protein
MKTQWPNDWQEFWDESKGGYTVGMDMFHTLHCVVSWQLRKIILTANRLNWIRINFGAITTLSTTRLNRLQISYFIEVRYCSIAIHYFPILISPDHCLEQVRQYIMCAGDLTPIPTRYYPALGRNYVDSDYPPHTCRSWDRLRGWVSDRINGSLAIKPKFRDPKKMHSP